MHVKIALQLSAYLPIVKAMTIVTGNTVHARPTPSVAIPSVVPLKYPPPTLVAVSNHNANFFRSIKSNSPVYLSITTANTKSIEVATHVVIEIFFN